SISDHTQSNWNGITGDISLNAKGEVFFDNIEVFPDVVKKAVSVRAVIINTEFSQQHIDVPVLVRLKNSKNKPLKEKFQFNLMPGENIVRINFSLGEEALLWDEFNPN